MFRGRYSCRQSRRCFSGMNARGAAKSTNGTMPDKQLPKHEFNQGKKITTSTWCKAPRIRDRVELPYRLYWRKRRDKHDQTHLMMETVAVKELKWDIYLSIVHHHKQLDKPLWTSSLWFSFLKKEIQPSHWYSHLNQYKETQKRPECDLLNVFLYDACLISVVNYLSLLFTRLFASTFALNYSVLQQ